VYQSPALVQALARSRVAELHASAEMLERPRRDPQHHIIESARHRTGWLLVDIGLRLALPRSAMKRRLHRGQRSVSI
jgi:hypothetical protein